jgi:hypothetical protein
MFRFPESISSFYFTLVPSSSDDSLVGVADEEQAGEPVEASHTQR